VHATGYEDLAAGIDILHAELTYPGMGPVIVTGGWHHPKSFPFSMEFTIVTDKGTLEWSSANTRGLEFFGRDGESSVLPLEEIDPFEAELRYFTECVQEGRPPGLCPPEQSAQAVVLMRFMLESRARNGKVIETS
ncbi:MAG TPA: hypothetical protein VHB50_06240, partial [Bryobacteraceae bacterium]|nr:hypothetical protein [Bryobacteraceae bacterium]